jgi:hypothetical protein
MCGSEPCAHERGDAITSFVTQTRALVAMTAERDAALALVADLQTSLVDALARIDAVQAVLRGRPVAWDLKRQIRIALEPTDQPKGMKP